MKVSYNWLQYYFDKKLPKPEKLAELITLHSYEVEGVSKTGDDFTLSIDVLPNRAHDSLSHRNIAMEISALLDLKLKKDLFINDNQTIGKATKLINVYIEDEILCKRYIAAVIKGVKTQPSPKWLTEYLSAIGQKSINNIVDALNFVMFDIGQPLHAFDANKLRDANGKYKIAVRLGKEEEKIIGLDGGEYKVGKNDLLIVDGNADTPIGIAGVKGGKNAEIDNDTIDIIVESANFDAISVRKTAKSLKLRTDASTRFENEISPELAQYGILKAIALIRKIAGGDVDGYTDFYPRVRNPYKVGVSVKEVNKLLGINISEKEVINIFDKLSFEYKKVKPIDEILKLASTFSGIPYKYGASLEYEAPRLFDCSGFIKYLYDQAGIGIPRISIDQFLFGIPIEKSELRACDLIFGKGSKPHNRDKVPEGIGHVGMYLGDGKIIHACGTDCGNKIIIENYRESKKFSGKEARGFRRMTENGEERFVVTVPFQRIDIRMKEDLIEEIGRVYGYLKIKSQLPQNPPSGREKVPVINKKFYYADKIRQFLSGEGFSEVYTYSFKNRGDIEIENPFASDKNFLRSNLEAGLNASLVENMKNLSLIGGESIKIFEIGNVYKTGKEYTSLGIGLLNDKKNSENELNNIIDKLFQLFGIKTKVRIENNVCEMNLDSLIEELPKPIKSYEQFDKPGDNTKYKNISPYPFALRDISIFVPKNVKESAVLTVIKNGAGEFLANVNLFDIFVKENKVSYAFRLVFQSAEKTLSDNEINSIMDRITDNLNKKPDWEVR